MENVKLKPRSSHWLLRIIDKIIGANIYWTTIGDTIYHPDAIDNPEMFVEIIEHEKVHIEQYKKLGVPLFMFLYIFMFLPIGLSYFRFRLEREAYLVELKHGASVDQVVDTLWRYYGWPWPKFLMRRWFLKQLK